MKRFYSAKSLYERLGVGKHSSLKEIKSAYYRQSLLVHPDVGGSAMEFQSVKEAYEILSNPDKRLYYDNHLSKYKYSGFNVQEFNQEEMAENEISPEFVISLGILLIAGAAVSIGIYYHAYIEQPPKIMQENINYHKSRAFCLENTPQDFYKIHHGPGWKFKKKS